MLDADHDGLIRAIRILAVLRIYAGLDVLTKRRMEKGQVLLRELGYLLPVSQSFCA